MKNECDIVKDLIFSYNDGILSETSKKLVENHLKSCENCSNVLKDIQQESHNKSEEKEIDAFKGIRKKITKKNIVISISLIFLILIIIFTTGIFYGFSASFAVEENGIGYVLSGIFPHSALLIPLYTLTAVWTMNFVLNKFTYSGPRSRIKRERQKHIKEHLIILLCALAANSAACFFEIYVSGVITNFIK